MLDALLLELDVPLPGGEQSVDGRIIGRRYRVADRCSEPAGFVDQDSWLMTHVRGPAGLVVSLSERIG